jgi:cytochrome P450
MISDADAAGELHHLFLAGFIIFALFGATIVALTEHPDVRKRLAASVASLSATPTTAELVTNSYLMNVVDEVRRLTPVVPVVFGRARRAFSVDGFTIPAGWRVAAAVWTHDREAASFADPERFDPDRFAARSTETVDAYAYAPQGAGPADGHRCPGFDLTTVFMALFTARLVHDLCWELPLQDLTPDWSLVPPVPRDGLRAVVRAAH